MNEHIEASDCTDASASARTNTSGTNNRGTNSNNRTRDNSRRTTQTLERERHSNPDDDLRDNSEDDLETDLDERWSEDSVQTNNGRWFEGASFLVVIFGILIPIMLPALFVTFSHKRLVLLLLAHPLETLVAIALCLSIPITNLKMHQATRKNNFVFGLKPGLAAGLAMGTALTITITCLAATAVNTVAGNTSNEALRFGDDSLILANMWAIGLLYLNSALASLHLVLTIRKTKELDSARRRILSYLCFGALSAALILIGSEVQTIVAHFYERQALSSNQKISLPALSFLRQINSERQLRLLCADSRSAGFAGLFIPIKPSEAERLYFMLEGKPFVIENKTDRAASVPIEGFTTVNTTYQMNAEQLKNFAIGAKIPGVSLTRSTINGRLHPDNLSATLVWTMVFQNEGKDLQTARAEISLPESAAITGAKIWQDGESIDGDFSADGSSSQLGYRQGPDGRLTELGRGKYLLQSKSLTPDSQVKMQVTMVVPMDLEQLESAQIKLPQIIASNFSLEGDHSLELLSDNKIENSAAAFTAGQRADGLTFLSGSLTPEQIENSPLTILCKRQPITNLASCKDKGVFKQHFHKVRPATAQENPGSPKYGLYLIRQIEQTIASAPGRVVVVLDGSVETSKYLDQIKNALNHIPSGIPVSVMVASTEDKTFTKPEDLKTAMPKLKDVKFTGGQENLKALVKAAEFAGQTKEGVVLWLHGRQPAFHKEIYIISPFAFKPALYEFAYDQAEAVDDKFFRNHSELASFSQVTRSGNQIADLSRFFRRWQAGRREYNVVSRMSCSPISNVAPVSEAVEKETNSLLARSINSELVAQNATAESVSFATSAGIVSLNSSIFFHPKRVEEIQPFGANLQNEISIPQIEVTSPSGTTILQGATNGFLPPQGAEATVVYGVNTAGTVRVNNLANLEALLNFVANFTEVILVIGGIVSMIKGTLLKEEMGKSSSVKVFGILELSRTGLIIGGVICIVVGLAAPGFVNFFVASARDAALFN